MRECRWEGFYGIGQLDGLELHLKEAPMLLKPLAPTACGTKDFYVEDPDGNILCFGGRPKSG